MTFHFSCVQDFGGDGASVLFEVGHEPVSRRLPAAAVRFLPVIEAVGVDVLVRVTPLELDELVARVFADVLGAIEEIGRFGAQIVFRVDQGGINRGLRGRGLREELSGRSS
jgi:hypothetical protein